MQQEINDVNDCDLQAEINDNHIFELLSTTNYLSNTKNSHVNNHNYYDGDGVNDYSHSDSTHYRDHNSSDEIYFNKEKRETKNLGIKEKFTSGF